MKKLNLTEQKGIAQIFLLFGMLLVAISLPIATKLVQQNQENRSKAASSTASSTYTTCTYTCTTWGACNADGSSLSGGTQRCTAESKTPAGCTGGSPKVGTTRNCTPTTPTPTQTATPTPAIKPCSSDTSYTRECVHSSFSSCESVVKGTTVCSGTSTPKCCVNSKPAAGTSKPAAGTKTYYYYGANGTCSPTSLYTSVIDCNSAKGVCFSSADACNSAYSCERLGGTCRSVCGADESLNSNGYYECQPAKCCVLNAGATRKDAVCGNQSAATAHPGDSEACSVGTVYWTDIVGTDGVFDWKCQGVAGGADVSCSATKGSSSSSGSSGSSGKSAAKGEVFSVVPTSLTLRVGETGVLTATEDAHWYNGNATTTIGYTAEATQKQRWVRALAVGSGVITAAQMYPTNASGIGDTVTVPVKIIASGAEGGQGTLSFKVAFAGIKPYYTSGIGSTYNCLASLGDMTVEILNRPTNTYQKITGVKALVEGNELDSKGNQVFRVYNLEVGSSLASVNTFNYVKVKGPFHLKRRMCKDGQTGKLDETTTCDINLGKTDGVPYNFSGYTLLAGDVDANGVINSLDFSLVKNAVNADSEPECGRAYDLNMDGVVNSLDLNLVKDALSSIDDE